MIDSVLNWLGDPAHWRSDSGVPVRLLQHLGYSALALVITAVIALPLGVLVGHTGRGRGFVVGSSGALRALPTLGLLTFLAIVLDLSLSQAIIPSTIVLVVLAFPSVLAGAYAGVESVPDDVVDGARASGCSELQVVTQVELPLALPLIVGGLRSAALQVVATTTVAAYLGLGGLGRYLFDGLAVNDYAEMLSGAVLVIVLALTCDALFALVQRIITPRGVRLLSKAHH